MIYLLVFLLLPFIIFNIVGVAISAPRYKGPVSDHFNGKKFVNPGYIKPNGLKEVLRWMLSRKRGKWNYIGSRSTFTPNEKITNGLYVTFINHSSFLIQFNGINILFDPVFSERTSPFEWAGPKRMRPPGIALERLPKIDLIILSHNHYDHFDVPTVRKIYQKDKPQLIVPLGVKAHLRKLGIEGIEMDWWQHIELGAEKFSIHCVPAQHFSGRGSLDRDATLWCGYVLHTPIGKVYYCGDTGYSSELFKTIGQRLGPMKVSMIPIGAYKPSWFMSSIHCSPDEAVRIHEDVRSAFTIAMHFGTFALADDSQTDPIVDLQNALKNVNLDENEFIVPEEGNPIAIL
jgi:L-ascorbate metabolism protein UlaG (beta-lactamase superfamily)